MGWVFGAGVLILILLFVSTATFLIAVYGVCTTNLGRNQFIYLLTACGAIQGWTFLVIIRFPGIDELLFEILWSCYFLIEICLLVFTMHRISR
ncbi:MAG TPA: hypothetical protein DIW81_11160 [Planctomycetaceae bacterium]|nr:hypothetical protein [Planctomycetaceae bacterium]|tara:strand:+ start:224 stop:502 length:279 start_codon:yes stop_codon:yes gene_type:complete